MPKLKIEDVTDEDIKFIKDNANGYGFGKNTWKATDEQIKQVIVLNDIIGMYHNMIKDLQKQKDILARAVQAQ